MVSIVEPRCLKNNQESNIKIKIVSNGYKSVIETYNKYFKSKYKLRYDFKWFLILSHLVLREG